MLVEFDAWNSHETSGMQRTVRFIDGENIEQVSRNR